MRLLERPMHASILERLQDMPIQDEYHFQTIEANRLIYSGRPWFFDRTFETVYDIPHNHCSFAWLLTAVHKKTACTPMPVTYTSEHMGFYRSSASAKIEVWIDPGHVLTHKERIVFQDVRFRCL